ncbi:holo-ACP synthase [candidate division WOR-3 bacterium]|jgi:holo-[acyl-carrier protein] synthase|nr:holo-ACP synthase [candidate division WOR-3 bacterium]
MIKGIGIDIIEIERIGNLINHYGDRFLNRIFTKNEIRYGKSKSNFESFAGMFAAKEAFIKASCENNINFKDIEILHNQNKRPYYKVGLDSPNENYYLSISHNKTNAIAFCIISS